MLNSLRKKIAVLSTALALVLVPVAAPVLVSADTTSGTDIQNNIACGTDLSIDQTTNCNAQSDTSGGASKVNSIITTIVRVFSAIVGVISIIMIIVGGFQYITSGGDSNKITNAKNTIVYALIGLVFVALAQFLVQFVLNKVAGSGS